MSEPIRSLSGIQIAGCGSSLPERRLTNADLETMMDTSGEWIVKRTGIHERRMHERGVETTSRFAVEASGKALDEAGVAPEEVELVIVATMSADMPTPSVSCVVAAELGTGNAGAYDLNAACSGFVFALNTAHALMRDAGYRTVLVVGADLVTRFCDYSTFGRGAAILFGDAAASVVLRASDDTGTGLIAQAMHSDGGRARHLYIPRVGCDFFEGDEHDERKLGSIQMNGPAVFKFAVSTFPKLIASTLEKAGLSPDEVDHYVCHQSNQRILQAARDRFGLPEEKLHMNIDRYGNTVAASVPLLFDEILRNGEVHEGQRVMFLGFGAGLTWGSSLWQI